VIGCVCVCVCDLVVIVIVIVVIVFDGRRMLLREVEVSEK
jgi:hypothetical protein